MKKMLTLWMALMLMLLPAGSLAGASVSTQMLTAAQSATPAEQMYTDALEAGRRIETTVTIGSLAEDTFGDEAIYAAVNDLLNALQLNVGVQGDEASVEVKISDKDVLTLGWAATDKDAYLASNLLGGTVYLTLDELQPLVERVADMFVVMEMMTQAEADSFKKMLPTMIEMMKAEIDKAASQQLTLDDLLAMDYSAIVAALTPILTSATTEAVTAQPKNSDPAVTVMTVTVTPDQFKAIVKSAFQFIKDNPRMLALVEVSMGSQTVLMTSMSGAAPSVSDLLDEAMASLDKEILLSRDMVIRVFLDEAGMPVLADTVLYIPDTQTVTTGEADGEVVRTEEATELTIELNYVRLTTAKGPAHTFNLISDEFSMTLNAIEEADSVNFAMDLVNPQNTAEGGRLVLNARNDMSVYDMTFDFTPEEDMALHMALTMNSLISDEKLGGEATLTMQVREKEEIGLDFAVNIRSDYSRSGVDFTGTEVYDILVNGRKLFDVTLAAATADPVASIMSGDVVRPAELNDNDLALWIVNVTNTVQSWPMQLLTALPQSVLQLVMGS